MTTKGPGIPVHKKNPGVLCNCGIVHNYIDLFDVIGKDVEMAGHCGDRYWEWEREVAEPELNDRGYTILRWYHGERDSFGPMSRIVVVLDENTDVKYLYYA